MYKMCVFLIVLTLFPSSSISTSDCECEQLLITSTSVAASSQSDYLGTYNISNDDGINSMNIWEQDGGPGSIFYGCYDEFCCQDCWTVGELRLPLPLKLIVSSSTPSPCPSSALLWVVWDGSGWIEDNTLDVTCVNGGETSPKPSTSTSSSTSTLTSSSTPHTTSSQGPIVCDSPWIDASSVGLGCIFIGGIEDGGLDQEGNENLCASKDSQAHLVEIYSREQFEYLQAKLLEVEEELTADIGITPWWWIGLTDEGNDGEWYWKHSMNTANYTHWDFGEPSTGESYNCAQIESVLDFEGGWISLDCSELSEETLPICQK